MTDNVINLYGDGGGDETASAFREYAFTVDTGEGILTTSARGRIAPTMALVCVVDEAGVPVMLVPYSRLVHAEAVD